MLRASGTLKKSRFSFGVLGGSERVGEAAERERETLGLRYREQAENIVGARAERECTLGNIEAKGNRSRSLGFWYT